jgi:hypothetical protein
MFRLIKRTFITLGLASGMTAGALFYLHNVKTSRTMVVAEVKANQAFLETVQTQDFLTELSRGR